MILVPSQCILIVFFSILLCSTQALSSPSQDLQLPTSNTTKTLWQTSHLPNSTPHFDQAWIEGILLRNRTTPIPAQAVGGILIQSLYSLLYRDPLENITSFQHTLNYPHGGSGFPFNVTLKVHSRNLPAPLNLDVSRLGTALSILGSQIDSYWDLTQMWEWDFDIGVVESKVYPARKDLNVIASGSIEHVPPLGDE